MKKRQAVSKVQLLMSVFFVLVSFALLWGLTGESPFCIRSAALVTEQADARVQLMDSTLADGFDFPFGDGAGGGTYTGYGDGKKYKGWYMATSTAQQYELGIHTGEDWNGNGKGNTDFGQPVYATASGKVLAAADFGAPWGNVVLVEHRYPENGKIVTVFSLYAHLHEISTAKGKRVKRREQIGTIGTGHGSYPAHLHFEIRNERMRDLSVTYWPSNEGKDVEWVKQHYISPSVFIKAHRQIDLPAKDKKLLVVVKHEYKMYVYVKGRLNTTYDVALSQSPLGHKEKQGDNRLPEGAYYITEKSRGPFGGDYKEYFGPAWMRLSYPNSFDAEEGFKKELISKKECDAIVAANRKRQQPSKATALGGGIGIHGWAGNWPAFSRDLTWGYISMKNKDLDKFYDTVETGVSVIILP